MFSLKPSFMILPLLLIAFLAKSVAAAAPLTLALNWKPEPQFGGFYQAEVAGLFKSHELDIKILEGGSGTPTVQMLAGGKVDVAIVSAEEILIANERNPKSPVVGIFAVYQTNPQILMCHQERGFQNLAELFASKSTLSWQSGLTYAAFLRKKYPKSSLKFVPSLGGIAPFLADKNLCQQGFLTSEPLLAAKSGAKVKSFLVSDEGFNPYTTVVALRRDTLDKNPELGKKLSSALRKAWSQYLASPKLANDHMRKLNPAMDEATFKASAEAQIPLIRPKGVTPETLGKMSEARWVELAEQLKNLGVIKAAKAQEAFRNL